MIPKTEMAKRMMRWMLIHTAPAPLSIDHPVQVDIAEAADTIERLSAVVVDMLEGLKYLRQTNSVPYGFGIDRLETTGKSALYPQERAP